MWPAPEDGHMTEETLLAPFDLAVIRTTAQRNDVEEGVLRDALASHQRAMRENPGVEDLVYEWRKQYDDPVLARTPERFVLALPPTVWEQYGDHLELDSDVFAALTAVHQEQTVRTAAVDFSAIPDGHTALIVARE